MTTFYLFELNAKIVCEHFWRTFSLSCYIMYMYNVHIHINIFRNMLNEPLKSITIFAQREYISICKLK